MEHRTRLGKDYTFSQSSLQDYLDCPRRFELRYVDEMAWPAVEVEPALEHDTRQRDALLFHQLVQQHVLGMPQEALSAMASSPRASRWWHNFVALGPDTRGWTLHPEKGLAVRVGPHRLVCKYDLLAIRDGSAVIYDWKTFGRRPTEEWLRARVQTPVYMAVLAKAGAELNGGHAIATQRIRMVYWFAEYPNEPTDFEYDDDQLSRDWAFIEHLVKSIVQRADFPLTSDTRHCRFCPFRSLCDRGRDAGIDTDGAELVPDPAPADSRQGLGADFEL